MKVTVVVPARNEAGGLIAQAVRSLTEQDYPRDQFEILVVDNASTDTTASEAEAAGADRVVCESQIGTNAARWCGVNEAQGKIVAFCDADHIAPPCWLGQLVTTLETHSSRPVAVAGDYEFSSASLWVQASAFVVQRTLHPLTPRVLTKLFRKPAALILGGNFAARRSVLLEVGIDQRCDYFGDDAALAFALAARGPVVRDHSIVVTASARRYDEGTVLISLLDTANYLSLYFRGRPVGGTLPAHREQRRRL